MGFQTSNAQQSTNVAPITGQQNGGGKARNAPPVDAYINVSMPTRQGSNRKLIGIPLSVQKPFEKKILDFIADAPDQEAALKQIAGRLTLDFQRADGNNGIEPDFGLDEEPEQQASAAQ